ncbi:hypothetical protein CIK76_17020 [Glutamicibacter sp. BW80]|nr:hypothetical protein CIK76_17020 [Glutamicibacter sp. BW80]
MLLIGVGEIEEFDDSEGSAVGVSTSGLAVICVGEGSGSVTFTDAFGSSLCTASGELGAGLWDSMGTLDTSTSGVGDAVGVSCVALFSAGDSEAVGVSGVGRTLVVSTGAGLAVAVAKSVSTGEALAEVADAGAYDPANAKDAISAALKEAPEKARSELLCFVVRQRKDF